MPIWDGYYPFLEGRPYGSLYRSEDKLEVPHVSDGVLFRVLSNLLILDGERLSYRTLDVEQIGSVYEAVMGFQLQVADGRSIAIKPTKPHGAPATINLEALLAAKPGDRAKWLTEQTDQKLTGQAADGLKKAGKIEDLLAALEKKIAEKVTPNTVPKGAMVLQPSDERRRSGSHYTPRSLTEPIVRTTLRPVLEHLGANPTPEQILELNVCDPAMGSGAFLVETCRQLGDELVKAWHVHKQVPKLPPDEDELLHARRMIAQRCLYGVDKNPMAVDLAKLSLWLATLAKDHPFTFLDHSLRSGDSLVGLSKKQIAAFHWAPTEGTAKKHQNGFSFGDPIADAIKRATEFRQRILAARDELPYEHLRQQLDKADEALDVARFVGDLVIAAYFSAEKDKAREDRLREYALRLVKYLGPGGKMEARQPLAEAVRQLRSGDRPVPPFHWAIEFPEVFGQENSGFDAIVGNPPFMGGTIISTQYGMTYFEWLKLEYPPAGHLCDLVAHFFRRSFQLLSEGGCFGLIATNTIAQGDTRNGGLSKIAAEGGCIYSATRRYRWPGLAAVVVSVVHVSKRSVIPVVLDGSQVERISAYLFPGKLDDSPTRLMSSPFFSAGSKIYGQGFLFDDTDPKATPLAVMHDIVRRHPPSQTRIYPYIGGEEVNSSPSPSATRYAIYLSDLETEDDLSAWPLLADIVRSRVKPERDVLGSNPNNVPLKRRWWAYQAHRPELYQRIRKLDRVLVNSQVSAHFVFTFLPADWIYAHTLNLYSLSTYGSLCVIQSRVHEVWARFFASSMKDDMRYTPSDCFETFSFTQGFETHPALEETGRDYYEFRATLMVQNSEGLTKTYNRFHDPSEMSPDILKLRELHSAMDRAVLDAYGWTGLKPTCEFLLDYEDEEENGGTSKKKKPWRYRWPDEFRDEVLGRLLARNRDLAEKEVISGRGVESGASKGRKTRREGARNLFPETE